MKVLIKIAVICCGILAVSSAPDKSTEAKKKNEDEVLSDSDTTESSTDIPYLPYSNLPGNFSKITSSEIIKESEKRLAARAERVNPAECPYYVSMQVAGKHSCGGALISTRHVLTAAHCIQPIIQDPSAVRRIKIEVGTVEIGRGQTHAVKRLSYHRQYIHLGDASPYIQPNDVAVITLKNPVTESDHVKIIGLPSAGSEVPAGARVLVSGFGNARVGTPTSRVLQKSNLYTVSHSECHSYYATYMRKSINPNSQICAYGGSGHGACQGDSGGPMVYNDQVIGLVSAGDGMCGAGNPDIYTKVSNFIAFIQSELRGGDENLCIAVDLDGESQSQNQLYPSFDRYPTIQKQNNPVQIQYYPVQQYPVTSTQDQYPVVGQYPATQNGNYLDRYPVISNPIASQQKKTYQIISQQQSSQIVHYPQYYPGYPPSQSHLILPQQQIGQVNYYPTSNQQYILYSDPAKSESSEEKQTEKPNASK